MRSKILTYRTVILSLCILLVLLFLFRPHHTPNLEVAPQNVLDEYTPAFDSTVNAMLKAGRFGDLDRMADDFRSKQTRFAGGNWKLSRFYQTLGDYDRKSAAGFEERHKELQDWLAKSPDSVAATTASLRLWINQAWAERGQDFSGDTAASRTEAMNRCLDEALRLLRAVDTENDPYALEEESERAMMIGDQEEVDRLYQKGVGLFPAYDAFYARRARELLPKWYGAAGELAKYTRSLLYRPGGNAGLAAYSFAAERIFDNVDRTFLLKESGLDRETIRDAYAAREKLYGLSAHEWGKLLMLAANFGDCETSEEAIVHIDGRWKEASFESQEYYDNFVKWVRDNENKDAAGAARAKALAFIATQKKAS